MENIIVHIFTIGFHHKRGCEIEFVYPPLKDDNSHLNQLETWKNLPSLALPDGAHKSSSDTINFIIPGINDSTHKVLFGISCFKQISAERVKIKSDDVTRNTIQKCVVILSTLPLFGAISALLRGITENYFEIGDFEERDILVESFHQLNQHFHLILEDNEKKCSGIAKIVNQELSITNLIVQYEHDILTLIKMILLRKRVLFFMEPMEKLTTTILSLMSLFPGILETESFQHCLDLIEQPDSANTPDEDYYRETPNEITSQVEDQTVLSSNINKSNSGDVNSPSGISLLENIKSGGGQTIKVLSSLTVSGVNAAWWGGRRSRSPESDNSRQHPSEDLSAPVPPFASKDGSAKNNGITDGEISRDNWGFPLDIFDQRNILLPYANIGMLNILDNSEINSFIIGANNQLWKMKFTKYDLIIHEDIKCGGVEFCQGQNQNKQDDLSVAKLLQLTVLDRRFADYLLQVVKYYIKTANSSGIVRSETVSSHVSSDLTSDGVEDSSALRTQETINIHKFSDLKDLEEWLRHVLFDYIKAVLLNAAALGTRISFDDFGWNFLLSVQQQSYFENWYYSVDRNTLVAEPTSSLNKILVSESPSQSSLFTLNTSGDNSELENTGKQQHLMNYDHPGRFIPAKIGDNIPGYYQLREYADHSKALVNKSVSGIKRFGSERGGQLKSSMTAGLSKLTGMAKVHGIKLSSSWWPADNKTADGKVDVEPVGKEEQ